MALRPDNRSDPSGLSATDDDNPDFSMGSIDWNDPAALFTALGARGPRPHPTPEFKPPADVRQEAMAKSDKLFTSYETLRETLKRHEALIRKRWRESECELQKGTQYRDHFIWPYINREDLLYPKTLPLLLNARGRHHPSLFAGADINAMHLGKTIKAIVPIFLNGHVMILNGVTGNTRDYGVLVDWEEHPEAFDWMIKLKQFLPGEGLLILEAQERLLDFLVQCCQQLLHDIPKATLTNDSFLVVPEPPLKFESEISGFDSLAIMAAEGPYRVPAQLDLRLVASLLAARASAAEDHLWALREDPDYFARTLLEAREHRQEVLKDLNGHHHPILSHDRRGILWARIIGSVVSEAYLELELFTELSSQAKTLVSLQRQYADQISPSKDLPEEYLEALLRFHHYIKQGAKGPLSKLKIAAVASPPLRRLFAREPPPDTHSTKIVVVSKQRLKMNKAETQLIWLLRTLWEDGSQLFLASLPVVVDELERLLQSDIHARGLLSSYITTIIGDLSIFSQCLNQLTLYQPWARSWDHELAERDENLKREYTERTATWARILAALQETSNTTKAVGLGEPSGGKFTYPVEKRRTKENVEVLRKAENNLDVFWAAIDEVMVAKAGGLCGTAVLNLLSQPRILQRTEEWVEPEMPPSAHDKSGEVDIYTSYEPLSNVHSGLPARKVDVEQRKTKVKTRGTPRSPPEPVGDAEVQLRPNPADHQPTLFVDARALKVFRTIFFNPTMTSTPGEVPWNDFLHAMASVGFTIMKLYGSVWQFQPTRLDIERSIQFHEPHPRGKLSFRIARRYGRRLNRAYGWSGGMFLLAQK
ncbi:hypothetical protein N7492_010738 [Penicillium capsulatum]|uniref:Uncharacterized protein n=1 Tax=Penicillium capsulatum TaxID=69766 RepID=A0A9W9HJ87_9EURO|nr:hypothetical protein N7492_010738 [Penicillium capsulatum]